MKIRTDFPNIPLTTENNLAEIYGRVYASVIRVAPSLHRKEYTSGDAHEQAQKACVSFLRFMSRLDEEQKEE